MSNDWLPLAMASVYDTKKMVINVTHADSEYYYGLATRHEPIIDCFVTYTPYMYSRFASCCRVGATLSFCCLTELLFRKKPACHTQAQFDSYMLVGSTGRRVYSICHKSITTYANAVLKPSGRCRELDLMLQNSRRLGPMSLFVGADASRMSKF